MIPAASQNASASSATQYGRLIFSVPRWCPPSGSGSSRAAIEYPADLLFTDCCLARRFSSSPTSVQLPGQFVGIDIEARRDHLNISTEKPGIRGSGFRHRTQKRVQHLSIASQPGCEARVIRGFGCWRTLSTARPGNRSHLPPVEPAVQGTCSLSFLTRFKRFCNLSLRRFTRRCCSASGRSTMPRAAAYASVCRSPQIINSSARNSPSVSPSRTDEGMATMAAAFSSLICIRSDGSSALPKYSAACGESSDRFQ